MKKSRDNQAGVRQMAADEIKRVNKEWGERLAYARALHREAASRALKNPYDISRSAYANGLWDAIKLMEAEKRRWRNKNKVAIKAGVDPKPKTDPEKNEQP